MRNNIKELKHKELLNELEEGLKHHFEGEQIYPVKIALLSKYLKTVKAAILLDSTGYFEDAQSLIRTLFELMIILLYCENNNAYDRYALFSFMIKEKYLNKIKARNLPYKKEEEDFIITGVEEFKSLYNPQTRDERKFWNGKNFFETAKEVSEQYRLEIIMLMYDALYSVTSGNIHSDSLTTLKYLEYDHLDINVILFKPDAFADNDNFDTYEHIKRINEILLAIFGTEEQ